MSGTTSIVPVSQIGNTILGVIRQLEASTGLAPTYDLNSTLNSKYGVAQTLVPTSPTTVKYFGIGIGGAFNVSSGNLSQPYPVLSTNMDLYTPIPFRCVPVAQDLTAGERANYRMRVRRTINGDDYFLYYLKLLTYNQTRAQITETDPISGLQTPYTLDYSNLTPAHPTVDANGRLTSTVAEVNVSVTSTLPLTGAEVAESINVLYAGDLRYAKISEIGLYSGRDKVISGLDGAGQQISYTEAILAQLNAQYT